MSRMVAPKYLGASGYRIRTNLGTPFFELEDSAALVAPVFVEHDVPGEGHKPLSVPALQR